MYEAAVVGVSAGGMQALATILPALPDGLGLAVVVVQHVREGSDSYMATHLNGLSAVNVKEAEQKETIRAGTVYMAPAGYHLLIEDDKTFSLSVDAAVNYARPSIDVLFEGAAEAYENRLVGVILTGANSDGARGLAAVKDNGGMAVVQDPETAEVDTMPIAALEATHVDHVLRLEEIAPFLSGLAAQRRAHHPQSQTAEP